MINAAINAERSQGPLLLHRDLPPGHSPIARRAAAES
jgi:hypothetical protein